MLLTVAKFPAQVQCYTVWQSLQFSPKPNFPIFTPINFHGKLRSGFCLQALKSKTQKKDEVNSSEMDGLDDFEDDLIDDDEMFVEFEDDGEFEGEDDEVIVPLENMKKWVENRPRGFGEGKVYDTSVEDKLMEEIEQSRQAQLVNVNNLKNNPVKPSSKKETSQQGKAAVLHIQDGFRVRLVNLPKKKNINRDLQLAFKGVAGIVNIVPLVSGNEKTRDPVCKGIAFIDFKYEDMAHRFVQNFSGQGILFGKVEKKIKCEMMKPMSPNTTKDKSVKTDRTVQRKPILDVELDASIDLETSLLNSREESALIEHDYAEERHVSAESEDNTEIKETSTTSESRLAEELEAEEKPAVSPSSSKRRKELKPTEKKVATKRKKDKNPKLNIPGSANRLKIREKAMLTDVFSKYGSSATLTVKEQSK